MLLAALFVWGVGHRSQESFLRLQAKIPGGGIIQLYFDVGHGFNEKESVTVSVAANDFFTTLRFPLPEGSVRRLRLDFSGKESITHLKAIALVDRSNALQHSIDARQVGPLQDIASLRMDGEVLLVKAGGSDPQLVLGTKGMLPHRVGFHSGLWLSGTLILGALLLIVEWGYGRRRRSQKEVCSFLEKILRGFFLLAGLLILAGGIFCWRQERVPSLLPNQGGQPREQFIPKVVTEKKVLQREDGLTIAGTIFRQSQGNPGKRPGVLLLHGNYPQGGGHPLYQVMGDGLAQRGFVVLAIDFAGYGESADPWGQGEQRRTDLESETVAALAYLQTLPGVDGERIGIVGHSMGADPTLRVGGSHPAVTSITLIGPPRRVWERFHFPPDRDFFWNWALQSRKQLYGKQGFPSWFSRDRWVEEITGRDMVHSLPHFAGWRHKPLLLLDGEREPGEDRAFLTCYFSRISYPKKYLTIAKADHDSNVISKGGRIYYDPVVMRQTLDIVESWQQSSGKGVAAGDLLRNLLRWLFAVELFRAC